METDLDPVFNAENRQNIFAVFFRRVWNIKQSEGFSFNKKKKTFEVLELHKKQNNLIICLIKVVHDYFIVEFF